MGLAGEMGTNQRTDTAHLHWDTCWQTEDGRADWLKPAPDVVAWIQRLKETGDARRVLDLGCGVGRHALYFAELGFQTSALDGSAAGLAELERQATARGLTIEAEEGLMTALPYADGQFDYVLAFNVIYHGDPAIVSKAIAEVTRVLKPGGHYQGTMLSKRNRNFGLGREIAPDTFVNEGQSDKAHPHFYSNAAELIALFEGFELMALEDKLHRKPGSWHWHMIAERTA